MHLLKRFTISSKVISSDVEEKHMIVRMLVDKGEAAVEPILKFMKTHHQVEWPVRALMKILPAGRMGAAAGAISWRMWRRIRSRRRNTAPV